MGRLRSRCRDRTSPLCDRRATSARPDLTFLRTPPAAAGDRKESQLMRHPANGSSGRITSPTGTRLYACYPLDSRRSANGGFPPDCDVHDRDLLCLLYVDTSRLLRANSGHSPTAWQLGQIDSERLSENLISLWRTLQGGGCLNPIFPSGPFSQMYHT
jgi:hypothetical protein